MGDAAKVQVVERLLGDRDDAGADVVVAVAAVHDESGTLERLQLAEHGRAVHREVRGHLDEGARPLGEELDDLGGALHCLRHGFLL